MRPSFHPRTVNGPFEDPGVFVSFLFEKRAVIFDLGDIYSLSARDILKISHVFVTHAHMDHFAGFDRLLRLLLGRDKNLYIYGPEGFFKNVEGKLAGYSWNLVEHYTNHFTLHVTEVHQDYLLTNQYQCNKGFIPSREPVKKPFHGILFKEPDLSFSAVLLDHRIPCIGFTMKEQFHVNIIKQNVLDLGFEIGPWLKEFKQALFNRQAPDSEFVIKSEKGNTKFVLGDLAEQIAIITPGQKITYITDIVYSESNASKAVELAKDADHLFIEAAFLEKDGDMAQHKYHLTAWQAGTIAGMARVKQFTVFHFSPRYTGMEHFLQEEAKEAYEKNYKLRHPSFCLKSS